MFKIRISVVPLLAYVCKYSKPLKCLVWSFSKLDPDGMEQCCLYVCMYRVLPGLPKTRQEKRATSQDPSTRTPRAQPVTPQDLPKTKQARPRITQEARPRTPSRPLPTPREPPRTKRERPPVPHKTRQARPGTSWATSGSRRSKLPRIPPEPLRTRLLMPLALPRVRLATLWIIPRTLLTLLPK